MSAYRRVGETGFKRDKKKKWLTSCETFNSACGGADVSGIRSPQIAEDVALLWGDSRLTPLDNAIFNRMGQLKIHSHSHSEILHRNVGCVPRRQLEIRNDWRGLLSEDDLRERHQKSEGSNEHRKIF